MATTRQLVIFASFLFLMAFLLHLYSFKAQIKPQVLLPAPPPSPAVLSPVHAPSPVQQPTPKAEELKPKEEDRAKMNDSIRKQINIAVATQHYLGQ